MWGSLLSWQSPWACTRQLLRRTFQPDGSRLRYSGQWILRGVQLPCLSTMKPSVRFPRVEEWIVYTGSHFGSKCSMLFLIHLRFDVVCGRVEPHADIPVSALVRGSHTNNAFPCVWVAGHYMSRTFDKRLVNFLQVCITSISLKNPATVARDEPKLELVSRSKRDNLEHTPIRASLPIILSIGQSLQPSKNTHTVLIVDFHKLFVLLPSTNRTDKP